MSHALRVVFLAVAVTSLTGLGGVTALDEAPGGECTPAAECCKICNKGKACGNSCISERFNCRKGRGCACDVEEVCG